MTTDDDEDDGYIPEDDEDDPDDDLPETHLPPGLLVAAYSPEELKAQGYGPDGEPLDEESTE